MKHSKPNTRKIPTPSQLLAKADEVEGGFDIKAYHPVMVKLRQKGLSFRAIAAWLSKELGMPITHVQVFRTMQADTVTFEDAVHNSDLEAELEAENEQAGGKEDES